MAPRQEHSTVAISSTTLAILGGIIPTGSEFSTTDIMQLYDIPSDTWTSASSLPIPINHSNAGVVDSKIFVLGALQVSPEGEGIDGSWQAIGAGWVYDISTDTWEVLAPLPDGTERGAAAVGVHNKIIYLAGGMRSLDLSPDGEQDTVDTVSAFDTVSGTWQPLPDAAGRIPEGRDHAGGAVVGDVFYVLGGRFRGQNNTKDTVFSLDLGNMDAGWQPMKLPRHGTSAVAVGERIYIPGGGLTQGADPVNVTDVYLSGVEAVTIAGAQEFSSSGL
ncbi:hypothetical protein J7T55_010424 [Diaporthe amygdali]|uniref:uncharacterized protein n=1 Tax=Phomopsis amygdali TaxID=1214568 RepID=UPI0022FDB357|nr:uncharacterized protein J7T55_010424 [Diaporthe amygdali]KAJ0115601.1 hypothetical protein J7T55_010424 [Diaporthe amygdali]